MTAGRGATRQFAVMDPSQPGEARRAAQELALRLGFDAEHAGRVALVVTELGSNLLKHAGGGELLLQTLDEDGCCGVGVSAVDRGPGIANLAESLRDGASTAGTPGTGLGAVRRLSDRFDLYSLAAAGTAIVVQLWGKRKPTRPAGPRLDVGTVCVAKAGEDVAGDDWMVERLGLRSIIAVADGLGHGPLAGEAAWTAMRLVRQHTGDGPRSCVAAAHAGLKGTRGGALAVAEVDLGRSVVRFCGLGNISAVIVGDEGVRRLVSQNGTAGHSAGRIDEFSYPWPPGGLLVLHSDGLATHWDLERYPGLARRHPGLIAGVLYRDFTRGRDDVTVIVARESWE